MKMPKPTPAHKKLHKLAGKWSGKEKLSPSPFDAKGGTAKGRVDNRVILDGFAVAQSYQQKRGGKNTFSGHGIFRYDADANEYQMLWVDNFGMAPSTFRGTFEKNVLTLSSQTSQGISRCTFDLSKKRRYRFNMEVSPDGNQWFPFMSGDYSQKG
jgi:hypothetical protein